MNPTRNIQLLLLSGMAFAILWGCPKSADVTSSPVAQKETVSAPSTPALPAETKTAEAQNDRTAGGAGEKAGRAGEGVLPIYFDFDKAVIREEAKAVLRANADWLKAHPKAKIKIEGNCDERGTAEYNQALGQRRAANAKKYLADLGVSGSRITLISYGKEKQICTGHDEGCWQKNRRDDFAMSE